MGRIVISSNVSLDGAGQDPTGEQGLKYGGWFDRLLGADREAWAAAEYEEAMGTAALLLGGRSYAYFADRWVGREGAWAEQLLCLPKYVVRSGEGRVDWGPTTVIRKDVVERVAKLKESINGDIVVYASYQLVHTLLEHDLVDEIRLVLFPGVLGSGAHVFGELNDTKELQPTSVQTVGERLVRICYDVVRP